jgi:hypothetical protein
MPGRVDSAFVARLAKVILRHSAQSTCNIYPCRRLQQAGEIDSTPAPYHRPSRIALRGSLPRCCWPPLRRHSGLPHPPVARIHVRGIFAHLCRSVFSDTMNELVQQQSSPCAKDNWSHSLMVESCDKIRAISIRASRSARGLRVPEWLNLLQLNH